MYKGWFFLVLKGTIAKTSYKGVIFVGTGIFV